jgi:SpoIID/LytB domain protein
MTRGGFMPKLAGAAVIMVLAAAAPVSRATPAQAYPFPNVSLVGHGWGHGRGMGQYGAYGYALAGQPYPWILDHYYGGTSLGSKDPTTPISVHLSRWDGADTIAWMTNAHLVVTWAGGGVTGLQSAVRVRHNQGGSLTVFTGPGCGGPWTLAPTGTNLTGTDVTIAPQTTQTETIQEMVQFCPPDGTRHWYRGSIVAKTGSGQTWNVPALDQYVRGVVPRESPASWGTSGGQEALRAQAVAARSYGLAYVASAGVICDTTSCQVYGGRAVANGDGSGFQDLEAATTDTAVTTTGGQVRICDGSTNCNAGAVAFTEFSSSTGGYSAGGTFPAVPDDGDATPSNPNHAWSASVPVSSIQATFPSIGTLLGVTVTQRNGLGDLGGRALKVLISGSSGTTTISGDQFAVDFGLRSNWFAVTDNVTGPSGGLNGYWLIGNDGGIFTFGAAPYYGSTGSMHLNQPIVGMAPTHDQLGYWLVATDGGIFTFGDAAFLGSTGNIHLNRPVVGMAPTKSGRGYWLVASDGGIFTFGDAVYYGSTGNIGLNRPIVGMAMTPTGNGYWLVASDGGIFTFGDAVYYGSTGNIRLNQPIVGMVATADGHGYLLVGGDGGIFTFGNAVYEGSLPGRGVADTIAAVQPTVDTAGYLMVSVGGTVYGFGDAPWFGGMPQVVPGYRGTILGLAVHRVS